MPTLQRSARNVRCGKESTRIVFKQGFPSSPVGAEYDISLLRSSHGGGGNFCYKYAAPTELIIAGEELFPFAYVIAVIYGNNDAYQRY